MQIMEGDVIATIKKYHPYISHYHTGGVPGRNEIDEMAEKVRKAGGEVFSEPEELQGWMYNVAFKDLDGHRWNMLYMDMEKMPK